MNTGQDKMWPEAGLQSVHKDCSPVYLKLGEARLSTQNPEPENFVTVFEV